MHKESEFQRTLCLFLLRGKSQGARIGYLKAALIASETEDLQKSLGLRLPAGLRATWVPFFVLYLFREWNMERLQVGRRGQAARQAYGG